MIKSFFFIVTVQNFKRQGHYVKMKISKLTRLISTLHFEWNDIFI